MVKVNTRQVGDVSVVDVNGRVTIGEGSASLGDTLRGLSHNGVRKILVNMTDVSYVDSSAIGELVSGYTTAARQGGQLKLMGLTQRVKHLLLITKHYTIFDVHDDEASAIKSFS